MTPYARDPRITVTEKAVLLALSAHGTTCHPTTARLAAELGVCRATLDKQLKSLRAIGALTWTNQGGHNYYKLLPYEEWDLSARDSKLGAIKELDNAREFWEHLRTDA